MKRKRRQHQERGQNEANTILPIGGSTRKVNENDVANWSAKFLRVLEATKGRDAADAAPAQVAAP